MLFLTTVKFFLSSISFKALIVVNNFRNVRGWAPNRNREPGNENPAKSPQALCQLVFLSDIFVSIYFCNKVSYSLF